MTEERDDEQDGEQRRCRHEHRVGEQQCRALRAHDEKPARVPFHDVAEAPLLGARARDLGGHADRAVCVPQAARELHVLAEVMCQRGETSDRVERVTSHGEELSDEGARIDAGEEREGVQ
ncbi:MAG: hypothetical protein NVS3B10_13980 [Polyangiales bacterium]